MFWSNKKTKPSIDSTRKISFEFFDPQAKSVFICGDFNSWDIKATPLIRDNSGRWKANVSLQPGRYEYRFFVNEQWCNDQRPVYLVDNAFGSQNCVIEIG